MKHFITKKSKLLLALSCAGVIATVGIRMDDTPLLTVYAEADGSGGIQNPGVGIGTTSPVSALHVPDGKYAQFEDNNAGAPPAADCDNDNERGRMSIDTTNNRLYICNGASRGWDWVSLSD